MNAYTAALFFLLSFSAAPVALAAELDSEGTSSLIREDFNARRACYLKQGKCNLPGETSESTREKLSSGLCPQSDTETLTLTLPATGGYTDTANIAHYCPEENAYWVLHSQGSFKGTISYWLGPFPLGKMSSPAPEPDSRPPVPDVVGQPVPLKPAPLRLQPGKPIGKTPLKLSPGNVTATYPRLKPADLEKKGNKTMLGDPVPLHPEPERPASRISNLVSPE